MKQVAEQIETRMEELGVVPVVVLEREEDAAPLAKALIHGGLPCAEITFRTAAAESAIRIITDSFPEMLVGAGTVLSVDQVKRAVEAGAKFIVSPGFSEEVAQECKRNEMQYFPGVITPSEIVKALSHGLKHLKYFPAGCFGGLAAIKALSAAFPQVEFMPTGGVSADNLLGYLSCSSIFACGGSWLVKGTAREIEEKTRDAVGKIAHI